MKILNVVLRSALFIGFAFMGSSLSCGLFDKVDDVTFNIELDHTFVINEQNDSNGQPVTYSAEDVIDATQNSEFAKYQDKIKEITITEVVYTVSDYSAPGSVTFSNGQGSFSANTGSAPFASASLAIQNIQASVGGSFTLNLDQSGLNAIAQQLKDVKTVSMKVSGTLSSTPVAFKVPVTLKCKITANAL